jgi:hypothetical protein
MEHVGWWPEINHQALASQNNFAGASNLLTLLQQRFPAAPG